MKITRFKIYLGIEILLFIGLLISQIIYMANGILLTNKNHDLFISIIIFHVALTLASLVYAIYIFCENRNKKRIVEDLSVLFFVFAFIADIVFSFEAITFIGHIFFILAYLTIMLVRKAKIYEYIITTGIGIVALVVLIIMNKLTLLLGLDCFLVPILGLNMIMCIINYVKDKSYAKLLLMIATIMSFVSDVTIGLSYVVTSSAIVVNTFALMTWPTYIAACVLVNKYYEIRRVSE